MTVHLISIPVLLAAAGLFVPQGAGQPPSGPETIHLQATASIQGEATGTVSVPMVVRIDRYTPEHARVAMTDALKYRGYPGFVLALRDSPVAGSLEVTGRTFTIRWAHQQPSDKGRTVTVVTEKPVFFIGKGQPDAKPTAGYEVAVLRLDLDATGRGEGVMAAAARVKPDGSGGVNIDNYAQTPMKLVVAPPPAK